MVHFAGYAPRFHPSDFHTHSSDGVGADWPIDYEALEPYYVEMEEELPVAGQAWPWGKPHRYPQSPHPMGGNGLAFTRGMFGSRHRRPRRTRSPSSTDASGTVPTASTGDSASRVARSTPRPRLSSPTSPTPWPTGPRSGPTAW